MISHPAGQLADPKSAPVLGVLGSCGKGPLRALKVTLRTPASRSLALTKENMGRETQKMWLEDNPDRREGWSLMSLIVGKPI